MSSNFHLKLAIIVLHCSLECLCEYADWHGGDWVMENLKGTSEAIGVEGEWANYVNTLAAPYDEVEYLKSTTKQQFVTNNAEPEDWYALSPGEIPYLAVLYRRDNGPSESYKRYFSGEPDPGMSHIEPGTACGGALLTPRHVLTVCGCVATLVSKIANVSPSVADSIKNYAKFDIVNAQNKNGPVKIYVTYSDLIFTPDFKHEVDPNWESWILKQNCLNIMNGRASEQKKSAELNSILIVAPFSPGLIPTTINRYFPLWPPRPVNPRTDPAFLQNADIISFGMRLSKPPPDRPFFSSVSSSSIEMNHCSPKTSFTCNYTIKPRSDDYTCFCPIVKTYSLVGGTIGWPIVQLDELAGLTASPRDSSDGKVAAAILSENSINLIQDVIGKNVLFDQNTVPPAYREGDLEKKYFIYDYNAKGKPRPDSKAISIEPMGFIFAITCTAFICSL